MDYSYVNSYVNCEIIDVGGQEEFNEINRQYYKRADCFVLVYDITDVDSFQKCKYFYKKEIAENCKNNDVKVILVGNKINLENDRKIKTEEGKKFAKKNNYYFIETSCEYNYKVSDTFEMIILSHLEDSLTNQKKFNRKLNKYINF